MGDELLWAVKNGDLDAVEKCLKKVRRPQTHGREKTKLFWEIMTVNSFV
jgi:hypothetical protein